MPRRKALLTALAAAVLVPAAATAAAADTTLDLVAYSTPKPVLSKIASDFSASPLGQGVSFTQSYGPSGDQAKAVIAG